MTNLRNRTNHMSANDLICHIVNGDGFCPYCMAVTVVGCFDTDLKHSDSETAFCPECLKLDGCMQTGVAYDREWIKLSLEEQEQFMMYFAQALVEIGYDLDGHIFAGDVTVENDIVAFRQSEMVDIFGAYVDGIEAAGTEGPGPEIDMGKLLVQVS